MEGDTWRWVRGEPLDGRCEECGSYLVERNRERELNVLIFFCKSYRILSVLNHDFFFLVNNHE